MNKKVMKKWVKALRSGKYKQGQGTLKQYKSKDQAKHCCLGVLCELYNEEMSKKKKKKLSEKLIQPDSYYHSSFHGLVEFNKSRDYLPNKVTKWAGMENKLGCFVYKNHKNGCLADLNDDGTKFKTIANIIEKNWENL